MLCSTAVLAGSGTDSTSVRISFSPEFWREKLKLSQTQVIEIAKIDNQFYAGLMEAGNDIKSQVERKKKIDALLRQRSERVWNDVFTDRQRAKWRKIKKHVG